MATHDRTEAPTRFGFDHEDGHCLGCDKGHAVERIKRSNQAHFYGCSEFPRCRNVGTISSLAPLSNDFFLSEEGAEAALRDHLFHDKDWG